MATSFIGKPISLISHSDVRYRGILAGIDPAASTIQLSNVFSMGTESRRPADEYIPPVQEPYAFIIFRASEVKDLAVDEVAPPPMQRQRSVHDDPAVIGASAPAPPAQYNGFVPQPHVMPVPVPVAPPQQQRVPPQGPPPQMPTPQQQPPQQSRQPSNRSNSVHTAAESLETVQRAIGEIRISQHNGGSPHQPHHHPQQQGPSGGAGGGGGGRRGHHGGGGHHHHSKQQTHEIKVPTSDFDFATSNAKFEKKRESSGDGDENKEKEKEKPAYDPSQSFFDSLSSGANARNGGGAGGVGAPGGGQGGGRRGGGNAGRNRREEERERNVATFGEPGGVGLMGPGAYVGGWGGYGRRGGGRGRRGGGPPRAAAAVNPPAAAGRS